MHTTKLNSNCPKAQASPSHIPWPQLQHTPWLDPIPLPSTPMVMVDQLLGHPTFLSDHRPSRHTGTSSKFHTCQCISNADSTTPSTRPIGTNEDTVTKHSACSPYTTVYKASHYSKYDASTHPGTASDPLTPKAPFQPGMTPSLLEPTTCTLKTPASSPPSSTSNPSESSSSALIPGLPMPSEGMPDISTELTQSTKQLFPRLCITCHERALMKLCGRTQIHTFNILLPLPTNDTDNTEEESSTANEPNCTVEESPTVDDTDNTEAESPAAKVLMKTH